MFYDCLFSSSQGWAKTFYKMPWRVNFATKIWPPLATCDAKTTLTYYIHYALHPHMVILSKKQLNYSIQLHTCLLYQLNPTFLSLGWSSDKDLIWPFWPSSWLAIFMTWFVTMQALCSYHSFARMTSKLTCTTYQSSHHHLSRFNSW